MTTVTVVENVIGVTATVTGAVVTVAPVAVAVTVSGGGGAGALLGQDVQFARIAVGGTTDPFFVDYADGTGIEYLVHIGATVDANGRFTAAAYHEAFASEVTLLDTSGAGNLNDGYLIGASQATVIAPTSTTVPARIVGQSISSENRSLVATSSVDGHFLYVNTRASNGTPSMTGVQVVLDNSGLGTVTIGRAIQIEAPYNAGTFTTLVGLDIGDLSVAANTYAIRTDGGRVLHKAGAASVVPLSLQAAASQSADMVRLLASDGTTIKHRYNKDGCSVTSQHSAPADADLSAGDMALWFDQTAGAAKLMIKAKNANGTVVTGSVNLA